MQYVVGEKKTFIIIIFFNIVHSGLYLWFMVRFALQMDPSFSKSSHQRK